MFSDDIYPLYDVEYYEDNARRYVFKYCDAIYAISNKSKYADWYIWLIQKCICRGFSKKVVSMDLGGEYMENHHIVPISVNKEFEKSKYNKVPMTAREHYVAHLLLTKMFDKKTQPKFYYKALNAIQKFWQTNSKQERKLTSHQFSTLRKLASELIKNGPTKDTFKTNALGKKCYTDGARNIFIDPDNGIPEGFFPGSAQKGYIGYTNGAVNISISQHDPIPDGFWRGSCRKGEPSKLKGRIRPKYDTDVERNRKIRESNLNKIWATDGVNDIRLDKNSLIPDGWYRGRTIQNSFSVIRVCCMLCKTVIDTGNFTRHYDSKPCKAKGVIDE